MTRSASKNDKRSFREKVDVANNYFLETSELGWFSVVVPEDSINLVENPTMRDIAFPGTPTGFAWGGTTPVVMDYTEGPYDAATLRVTPTVMDSDIWYDGGFGTNGDYTFSVVIRSDVPIRFKLVAADGNVPGFNQTVIKEREFVSTQYWTQYSLTFNNTAPLPNDPYLVVRVVDVGQTLEIGFWQSEEKLYATTPFSGDFSGGRFEDPDVYFWLGIPHQSRSFRSEETYTGGRVINLKELGGLRVINIEGLGIAEQNIIFDPLALQRGSLLRGKQVTDRTVTIDAVLYNKSFKDLLSARNELGKVIFSSSKERLFRFQLIDCGEVCSPCVEFVACYENGFAGDWGSHFGEEVSIDLRMLQVEVSRCEFTHEVLEVERTLVHQVITALDESGVPFNPLATQPSPPQFLDAMKVHDLDGNLYYAGFDGSGELWCYDGVSHTQIADINGGRVEVLYCFGRKLYVGGSFNNVTGIGTYSGISGIGLAELDIFTEVVTNIGDVSNGGLDGTVAGIAIGKDNTIYIAGNFDDVDGTITPTNFAARDSSGTWFIPQSSTGAPIRDLQLGTVGGQAFDMIVRESGDIVVVGDFQNGNIGDGYGIATLEPNGVLVYHPTTKTHTRVDFPNNLVPDTAQEIYAVVEYRGTIYVGGRIDLPVWSGSLKGHIYNIAYIDFNQFSNFDDFFGRLEPPVGMGLGEDTGNKGFVNDFVVCGDRLYIAGRFTQVGPTDNNLTIEDPTNPINTPMCGGTVFTGLPTSGVFTPFPASLGTAAVTPGFQICELWYVDCGSKTTDTSLIVGVETTQGLDITSQFFGATEFRVCDDISTKAKIFIEGPGFLESISVNGVEVNINRTLQASEILVIRGDTIPVTAFSTFQGDLGQIGLKTFTLNPEQDNLVTIQFTVGTTSSGTRAWLQYKRQSYSADILCEECE